MEAKHQVAYTALTAHAFNADRSQVAVCANSNEAQILDTKTYKPITTLGEHDKLITSIDWAPSSNRIVTCSQDRNAYVWNLENGKWKPTLVLLRLNRSATFVRWSPSEAKFAVASGARTIAVCSYDSESNWWIAKQIKKPLRSTVLSLDWHPNSVLLAAGSADSKARVFSAYIKEEDSKPAPTVWGSRLPFNTVCGEFASSAGGWVHGVAFSPSGDALAFCAHDSTVTVVYPSGEGQPPAAVFTIRLQTLPLTSLLFINEYTFVAAGHDCEPVLFEGDGQRGWAQTTSLDDPATRAAAPTATARVGRLNNEAFNTFRQADSRGVRGAVGGGAASQLGGSKLAIAGGATERMTVHQNTITTLRAYDGEPGNITRISTSGVDGLLAIWNVAKR